MAISWFNGDIPQLHTMMSDARAALDNTEWIIKNKHSASSTGTQQPCNMSPVFFLLKYLQAQTTAQNDTTVGLADTIHNLFVFQLRSGGLNLDRNPQKKSILVDFMCCLPEMAEKKRQRRISLLLLLRLELRTRRPTSFLFSIICQEPASVGFLPQRKLTCIGS